MIGTDITSMSRWEITALERYGDAVYRLYDAAETLLYVGVAGGTGTRFGRHRREKSWWPEVVHRTAVWYRTRIEAFSAETLAIHTEKPLHNLRKDHPLPIRADGAAGGWIHMIPEMTLRSSMDRILATIDKHNLTIGVAAQGSQTCRAVIVPIDWYRSALSAIGEAAIKEPERQP